MSGTGNGIEKSIVEKIKKFAEKKGYIILSIKGVRYA